MTDIANNKVKIQNVGVKQAGIPTCLLNAVIFEDDSSKRNVLVDLVDVDLTFLMHIFPSFTTAIRRSSHLPSDSRTVRDLAFSKDIGSFLRCSL